MFPVKELGNIIELEDDSLVVVVEQGNDALEDKQVFLSAVPGLGPDLEFGHRTDYLGFCQVCYNITKIFGI